MKKILRLFSFASLAIYFTSVPAYSVCKAPLRYQEQIWLLERNEKFNQADALKTRLQQIFSAGQYSMWNPVMFADFKHHYLALSIGIGPEMSLFKFGSGVKGVFKPAGNGQNPDSAVAAYQIDQLFHFSFVPMIIRTEIDGKIGSLQYFVKEAPLVQFTQTPFDKQQYRELELFDYLTGHWDRSPDKKNFLVRSNGYIVAIDNDSCFSAYNGKNLSLEGLIREIHSNPKAFLPNLRILRALREIPIELINERLTPFMSEENILEFLRRKETFLKILDSESGADS